MEYYYRLLCMWYVDLTVNSSWRNYIMKLKALADLVEY